MKKTQYVLVHRITRKLLVDLSTRTFDSAIEAALFAISENLCAEIVPVDSGFGRDAVAHLTPPG